MNKRNIDLIMLRVGIFGFILFIIGASNQLAILFYSGIIMQVIFIVYAFIMKLRGTEIKEVTWIEFLGTRNGN